MSETGEMEVKGREGGRVERGRERGEGREGGREGEEWRERGIAERGERTEGDQQRHIENR